MKALIITAVTITMNLFALTAKADNGIESAARVCHHLTFSSDKITCLKSIRNAYFFSDEAVEICSGLTFNSDKTSCLKIVANKEYRPYELEIIKSLTFSSDKISALNTSGKKGNNSRGKIEVGVEQAAKVCQELPFSSDKTTCLKTIRDVSFFSSSATAICSSLTFSSDKILCLKYISNKNYRSYELDIVNSLIFSSDKLSALKNSGEDASRSEVSYEWSNKHNCKLMINGEYSGKNVDDYYCR